MAPPGTKELLPGFLGAIQSPVRWFAWVWVVLGILVIIGVIQGFARNGFREDEEQSKLGLSLYCGVTLLASIAGFIIFLDKEVSFSPQVWHYVPFLVVAVISAEPLVEHAVLNKYARSIYLLVIGIIAVAALLPASQNLTMQMTSIELVASAVEREARPSDLVIVNPWYLGVSFSRYYRGTAPWTTFPALQETSLHRYDLLKERMKHPETISGDISRISSTLRQGGRIWVVGDVYRMNAGLMVTPLPAAPLPGIGWTNGPYVMNWNQHLMSTLATHSRQAKVIAIHVDRMINPLESPALAVFQGWTP